MARINQDLLQRIQTKLGVGRSRIYRLIEEKVNRSALPRHLAAIAVGMDSGVNISRFASHEDLAEIRRARSDGPPISIPPMAVPTVPQARGARRKNASAKKAKSKTIENSVFVVHGRDLRARDDLFRFLRAIGLQPIEWSQAIKMSRRPAPYIGEILDAAMERAAAVVVLLTPDDEARLRAELRNRREPVYERELTGQARANVLFEAGMAFARHPARTVLVQLGDLRPFSDVGGRHMVHLSNAAARRQELATKLENAGCDVDRSGADWLSEGDFER